MQGVHKARGRRQAGDRAGDCARGRRCNARVHTASEILPAEWTGLTESLRNQPTIAHEFTFGALPLIACLQTVGGGMCISKLAMLGSGLAWQGIPLLRGGEVAPVCAGGQHGPG